MKFTKQRLKRIIKEELQNVIFETTSVINEEILKEDYVYNKILMPTQKNPSDDGTQCFQGLEECPPDRAGHFAAAAVGGYTGPYGEETMADFKIFWNPICNGQEGNFEQTRMVHKWVPQLQPEQLKQYACEYKQAFADGLLAYRDYKAEYYPNDWEIEKYEDALKVVVGMVPERPEAISTPQERSLEQEKESKARRAEKASADRFMRGEEPWEPMNEQDEDYFREDPGHPAVVKANDALHEAYLAVDELADIIEQQPDSVSDMAHAEPSLADVKSKIESLGFLLQHLG